MLAGVFILFQPKGTKWHKVVGKSYIASMLGLNVTAFGIYNLFGGFGIFHWVAIISIFSVIGGLLVVYLRTKIRSWVLFHYELMVWSYIGLLAATSNEVFVHVAPFNEIAQTYIWLPITTMFFIIIIIGAILLYGLRSRLTAKFVSSRNT